MANLARVEISYEFLIDFMTEGHEFKKIRCIEGLPEGVEIIRSYNDEKRGVGVLVVRHDSFDDVPWGAPIPAVSISFERWWG
uniref:Uncharacterized protein n=1 Tax=viral metagenome TaxID=1070528 RepID=A0A6M3J633_9ZZZZ